MLTITQMWIALKTDRRAVTAVEYAMIVALIAAAMVATVTTFATSLEKIFTSVGLKI